MSDRLRGSSRTARILPVLALALFGAAASGRAQATPDLAPRVDAQGLAPLCTPDEHTLCLNLGRFAVNADFQITPLGPSQQAHAVPVTDQTGNFWFFDPANVELVVKVLNGCVAPFNTYWFFAAGLTNV